MLELPQGPEDFQRWSHADFQTSLLLPMATNPWVSNPPEPFASPACAERLATLKTLTNAKAQRPVSHAH